MISRTADYQIESDKYDKADPANAKVTVQLTSAEKFHLDGIDKPEKMTVIA